MNHLMVISILWLIGSIIAIYIDDREYRWNGLSKIFFAASVAALLFNGWQVYDPSRSTMIATIELNPTWTTALLLSFAEGACITGPIAAIHAYNESQRSKRELEKYKKGEE